MTIRSNLVDHRSTALFVQLLTTRGKDFPEDQVLLLRPSSSPCVGCQELTVRFRLPPPPRILLHIPQLKPVPSYSLIAPARKASRTT